MEDFKKLGKSFMRNSVFAGLALVLLGALFVIFPESSGTIICYATGAVLCAWGIIQLIVYFSSANTVAFGSFGLVYGAILAILGASILIQPNFLKSMLTLAFGLIVVADAVLKLQYAIDLMRIQAAGWLAVLITAILMAIAGVIVVLNPFATAAVLTMFVGIVLIVDGVADLATTAYISRCVKSVKKTFKDAMDYDEKPEQRGNVVDVDYKDVP